MDLIVCALLGLLAGVAGGAMVYEADLRSMRRERDDARRQLVEMADILAEGVCIIERQKAEHAAVMDAVSGIAGLAGAEVRHFPPRYRIFNN